MCLVRNADSGARVPAFKPGTKSYWLWKLGQIINCLVQNENEIIALAHEAKVRIKWYLHVQFLVHSKNSIKCQLLLLCVS